MIDRWVTLGMVSETLGRRIKRLRLEAGLSQFELGVALGVGNQMISQWERGARVPTRRNQERLAQELNVTHAYLTYGQELDGQGRAMSSDVAHIYDRLGDRERRTWLRIGHVLREEQERYANFVPDSSQVEEDEHAEGERGPLEEAASSEEQLARDALRESEDYETG